MTTQKDDKPVLVEVEEEVRPAMGGFDLGLNFMVSILLCGGVGYGVDRWLGSLPWGMLIGFVLGFCAGLYVIWKKIQKA